MYRIKKIHAHEILDSRGNPTVSVSVLLDDGTMGTASVPSGASTGTHEALELRDGDKKHYGGKGVTKACTNVNGPITKALRGFDVRKQSEIDAHLLKLDGTKNKSRLGANAILGVSLACAHAGARTSRLPLYRYIRQCYQLPITNYQLPLAMMNILNGGAHADWSLDLQEFMLIPQQTSFRERVRCGAEIFHALHDVLKEKGYSTGVGDEGGFAPRLKRNEDAFIVLSEAVDRAGYNRPGALKLGIDAAASEFYDAKTKRYELKVDHKKLSSEALAKIYESWMRKYPLVSIEDPFAEDDWDAWQRFTEKQRNRKTEKRPLWVVGDDLFVTNVERLQKGIKLGVANAILIKLNQIGTLSETIEAILLAKKNRYAVIISHRSGETSDTTIADLAVAVNADAIKTGSLSRSERVSKYNRLMEIEEELQN